MSDRLLCVLKTALVAVSIQGLAVVVYLGVDRHRAASRQPSFDAERLAPGRAAPSLLLVRPDGSTRRLSELRGKAVLLHFWATWCPPCREELPGLLALGRDLGRDGALEVIAVTLDDDWAAVGRFFGGDIPVEVVRDASSASTRIYEVSALPDTYLVGPDGALTVRVGGARDWRGPMAQSFLRDFIEDSRR
ncbi:MAG: TlpA family protein disulfide reductase [Deltaproteobacteria bacterium]|nr:TlpA family protein disulfide reductase [Deltaproteobacteria bacterium]